MSLSLNQPEGQPPDASDRAQPAAQETPLPQNPYMQSPQRAPLPQNFNERPSGYGYVPPQGTPQPLGQALKGLFGQYVKVLTRPGVQSFEEEQSKAGWGIIWIQLLGIGLISTIVAILHTLLENLAVTLIPHGSILAIFSTLYSLTTGGFSIFSLVSIIVEFFVVVGIQYLLARAFGGNGYFKQQGYSYLLFYAPLTVISSVLSLTPGLGLLVGFAIGIYQTVLNVFSIMAAQRLRGGKATAVVLIPVGVVLLFFILFFVVFVLLIVHGLQGLHV